jgi:hypothetical protein
METTSKNEHTLTQRSFSGRVVVHSFNWARRLAALGSLFVVMYFAYRYLLDTIIHGSWAFGIILFWVLTAYITIPRIHRQLTKIYLPDYYVGRSRTGDGLLGDPINIAVNGSAKDLRAAMLAAGWVETDRATPHNILRLVKASLLSHSYPRAPGSSQFLFGYRQAYSFQKEERTPRSRHHVRFWKTPESWWLPGGDHADWLGAVHYDKYIGVGLFNGQIMHKIREHIDDERDLLVSDLLASGKVKDVRTVAHFTSGLHGRGGGGDRIRTDGAMPFVNLQSAVTTAAAERNPTHHHKVRQVIMK